MVLRLLTPEQKMVPRLLTPEQKMVPKLLTPEQKMVPRFLTPEQKEIWMNICADILQNIENNPDFLENVITCDESWFSQYDPESKHQSMH